MPRFYGDRIDIVIENGQTFDDAMRIVNSSACSLEADFGYCALSQDDQESVNNILAVLEEDEGIDA